jgi:metal-responsive CopG/Arc/MetJ family transcriptional regulator
MTLDSSPGRGGDSSPVKKRRKTRTLKMTRISLSISDNLLAMVDKAAEQDFTTRSDMIRMAIVWYVRPQGRELALTDPGKILKVLEHRRARAAMKEMIKDIDLDVYDG